MAGYLIFVAVIFDFFDGFAARLLKAHSPIGLQLDSLADMVSFGVAPAMMLFYYNFTHNLPTTTGTWILAGIPFVIAVFSALRLAKFNIDTRQTESFIGLATTACGLFIASLMIHLSGMDYSSYSPYFNEYTIAVGSVILSLLLVAEIPMFSLKIKKPTDGSSFAKKYKLQIILIIIALILIALFRFGGIAITILLYIVISITKWLTTKREINQTK